MREFEYESRAQKLLTQDIVSLISGIHEYRGKQTLYLEAKKDVLEQLVEIAKIQSTDASNRIEGIYTTEERLRKIVLDKTAPKSRSEKEIAGYRDVLSTIHENYDYIPVKASSILQLHRDLYKFTNRDIGGVYKVADNEIAEIDAQGNKTVRFVPVSAWETADHVNRLCEAYDYALANTEIDPLLVMPMFILDFLCIHPFSDGNGRMSRLLTLLLLYKQDYLVGKYISIEKLINSSKETYYEALQESSWNWHEGENDYTAFVRYMLGVVIAAYREFAERVDLLSNRGLSKPQIIREEIKNTFGKVTADGLSKQHPDISLVTIRRTLKELLDNDEIIKIGGGRYTSYTWNREKD